MRRLSIFLGIASLFRAVAAPLPQGTPEPLAPGPLLNRAPEFSQWLVCVKSGPSDGAQAPDQKTKYNQVTRVRKTGSIRYETTANADGRRYEKWCSGNLQATVIPGVKDPEVAMGGGEAKGNVGYTDYSKSDFPGFEWIATSNYIGTQVMAGVPCIVFHAGPGGDDDATHNPGAPAAIPKGGSTAYIAADSRLPVLLVADGAVTFYQFETPPATPLMLPPDVQSAFDHLTSVLRQAAAPPPPP
jgi:hypothetical protein